MQKNGASPTSKYREPRLDGDLKKPRAPKCTRREEIMDLISGVSWVHLRIGISEAAMGRWESLVPTLSYLAKHGWNEDLKSQGESREKQFSDIAAMLAAERMEQEGMVGRSTVMNMIPAQAMNAIRESADPLKTAWKFRERIKTVEDCERQIIRKRAMEALGEIGSPAAIAELVKLIFCTLDNKDIWAASVLERAAKERPAAVVPVLREAIKVYSGKERTDDGVETLEGICARAGKA